MISNMCLTVEACISPNKLPFYPLNNHNAFCVECTCHLAFLNGH